MMRTRSVVSAVIFASASAHISLAQAAGVGQTIDEGTFSVTRTGAPARTESFKIVRMDNGQLRATAQVLGGDERITSTLMADSVGTPIHYAYGEKSHGAMMLDIVVLPRGRRLAVTSSDNRSNETMKEMPFTPGLSVLLDEGLAHQFYFVPLGKRTGSVELIEPQRAQRESFSLVGRGLEEVQIARHTVTATHYSLVNGAAHREFWVDANGRVLKVEVPAIGLVALREELPR